MGFAALSLSSVQFRHLSNTKEIPVAVGFEATMLDFCELLPHTPISPVRIHRIELDTSQYL